MSAHPVSSKTTTVPSSANAAVNPSPTPDDRAERIRPLRRALLLDAGASGAMGLLLVSLASDLASPLGLPEALLRWAGAVLVPFAACVALLGTRPDPHRGFVMALIWTNVVWVLISLVLPALPNTNPTTLGTLFVVGQAATVAWFVVLQLGAVRILHSFADRSQRP